MVAEPWSVAGFFYHPRMLAVVHLVTLGWITSSILGALYWVAPMALGFRLPARWPDVLGFILMAGGLSGMVVHFWIDEPFGMACSAVVLTVGLAIPASRFLRALGASKLSFEIKLPFRLAFFNLFLAAFMGLLMGFDKVFHFLAHVLGGLGLGGHVHDRIFAHAHLAAVGFAMMMVMATGYRLFPMFLPSAMPVGRWVLAGSVVLEIGILGLFGTLLAGGAGRTVFAALIVAGFGIFFSRLRWMTRNRRPPPKARRLPDLGVWQIRQALVYLVASLGLGLALAATPAAPWKLPAAMVYGVISLLGFLGQIIGGVAPRLLSLLTWMWGSAEDSFREPQASPYDLPLRLLQGAALALWTLGVPLLAVALALDHLVLLRVSAGWLLMAVLLQAANTAWILRHAWRRWGVTTKM